MRFTFHPSLSADQVALAGSFNGWSKTANIMDGPDDTGTFTTELTLLKGRHEYKFLIDARRWVADPGNARRSGPYGNSLLILGFVPDGDTPPAPDDVATMARSLSHPPAVRQLAAELTRAEGDQPAVLRKWFTAHPMPWISDTGVSFVYAGDAAKGVDVEIVSRGHRTGYPMTQIVASPPVFGLTLEGAELAGRAAYLLVVHDAAGAHRVLDPNAWSVTSRGGQPAGLIVRASPDRGRVVVHTDVKPARGDLSPRDVYVYLPPGYDRDPTVRYPVLYMHDGQNGWDDPVEPFGHGGWTVNLIADRLISEKKVVPFIVVGVANTAARIEEYGPGTDILDPRASAYLRFLVDDVRTMINRTYRTRTGAADTAVMGSSLGGAISLQAALLHPDVFGQAACLSPAFLFTDAQGRGYIALARRAGKLDVRLYIDHGTAGPTHDGAARTRAVVDALRRTGWRDGMDLLYFTDQGAGHNERAWRARLTKPLRFLFGCERR